MNHPTTLRTCPRFATLLAILTVCGAATLPGLQPACRADEAGDKTYTIKLAAPAHVGDKFNFSASCSQDVRNEITVGKDKPILQNQAMAVQLEGAMEVLAVDSKGGATKLGCTIKKFVHTDSKDAEILPPGAVVIADGAANPADPGDKTHFSLKDGALTAEQTAALGLVLEAHTPESATDDEVFGTDKPQKIGATWPMDAAKAAADLGKDGMKINPEDLKGEATLVGTEKVAGTDFLKIKAHVVAKNLIAPLPNGLKLAEGSKLEVEMSGLFSAANGARRPFEAMDVNMDLRATGATPDGGAIALHVTMKMHREGHSTPQ